MRASIASLLLLALLAGCASARITALHEARVRDARQCEIEAESYVAAARNANDIRHLMIESCMAMRGHTTK
jgi:hypothetical protein